MGVCFLGFGHDASVVGNTAQETVIIAQPPESPSLSLLYLKVIPVISPLGVHALPSLDSNILVNERI